MGSGMLVGDGAGVGGSGLGAINEAAVASTVAASGEFALVGMPSDEQATAASIKTTITKGPTLLSMHVRLSSFTRWARTRR